MKSAPLPQNEDQRIAELRSYDILDTSSELDFDQLVLVAATVCQVPISLVSLVDCDRQWFKAETGLGAQQTTRDVAFCAHAILENDLFEVPNALLDDRFKDNPLVLGGPKIRFYVGAQLMTESGFKLGTLCVIDTKPRNLSNDQRQSLRALAHQVVQLMELRKTKRLLQQQSGKLFQNEKEKLAIELIPGFTHQINNPLVIINGHSMIMRTLAKGLGDPLKELEFLKEVEVIENSVKRVSRLVRTFRTFSRPAEELSPESLNLTVALKDALDLSRSKIVNSGVEVEFEESENYQVKANHSQLLYFLLKLCSEGIASAEASTGKEMTLTVEVRLRQVEIVLNWKSKSTRKVENLSIRELADELHAAVFELPTGLKISFPLT